MKKGATLVICAPLLAVAVGCGSSQLGAPGATGGSFGSGGASQTGGAGGTLAGDGGGDAGYASQLAAAQAAWAAAKPACRTYRYQTQTRSVFGSCATTTVEIANDQAVSRSFIEGSSSCSPTADGGVIDQWSEVGAAQLGTHDDGDPARTVEQLAEACQQVLALDPSKYTLFFSAGTNGVPSQCTATLRSCVDDCTGGIQIPSFVCETGDAAAD